MSGSSLEIIPEHMEPANQTSAWAPRTSTGPSAGGVPLPRTHAVGDRVSEGMRIAAWPLSVLAVIAHVVWRDEVFTPFAATCCGMLAALAILMIARARYFVAPIMPYVLLHWYLTMGMPAFYPVQLWGAGRAPLGISQLGIDRAALGVLLFAVTAVVVFVIGQRVISRTLPALLSRWLDPSDYGVEDTWVARGVAMVGLTVSAIVSVKSGGNSQPFGSFTLMAVFASNPGVVLGFLLWDATRRPSLAASIWFYGTAIAMAGLGLLTGMLGAGATIIVAVGILLWTFKGRVPWLAAILSVVAIIGLNTAKHSYRAMTWRDGQYVSISKRAENWAVAIDTTYTGREQAAFKESADSASSRLRTFAQVAQIFDWVPDRVGHTGIDQWLELPLDFVPRILWPEKTPHVIRWNRAYTLAFGIQNVYTAQSTAVTLPAAGDGYWRLGWLGVVLEGTLFGLMFAYFAGAALGTTRAGVVLGVAGVVGQSVDQHVFALLSGLPQQVFTFGLILVSARLAATGLRAAVRPRGFSSLGAPKR